ncbi:putative Alpha beta hydrolase fold family [Seiridium cardinale]
MVTYSDLKALFINTIYEPLSTFPVAADLLHQLEGGNVSALAGMFDGLGDTSDARLVIQCADSYRRNRLTTIEEFKSYAEYTTSKSRYIGDIYPIFIESILYPTSGLERPTSFPILFASNTVDPLTPLTSARKMYSRFPGSVLPLQEAVGA